MSIYIFRSNSKSSKKKPKKLLNILVKSKQPTIKVSEPEDIDSEDVNDDEPNEFDDSKDEDEDRDMTATIGISLYNIINNV